MSFSPHRHRHPSPSPNPSCPSCHPVPFFPHGQDAQDLQDVLQPPPPPSPIAFSHPILSILPSCPLLSPPTGCTGSTGCPSAPIAFSHPILSILPSCPLLPPQTGCTGSTGCPSATPSTAIHRRLPTHPVHPAILSKTDPQKFTRETAVGSTDFTDYSDWKPVERGCLSPHGLRGNRDAANPILTANRGPEPSPRGRNTPYAGF